MLTHFSATQFTFDPTELLSDSIPRNLLRHYLSVTLRFSLSLPLINMNHIGDKRIVTYMITLSYFLVFMIIGFPLFWSHYLIISKPVKSSFAEAAWYCRLLELF